MPLMLLLTMVSLLLEAGAPSHHHTKKRLSWLFVVRLDFLVNKDYCTYAYGHTCVCSSVLFLEQPRSQETTTD